MTMTQKTMIYQSNELNAHARKHEKNGDSLLASWMRQSARKFERESRKLDKAFDEFESHPIYPDQREDSALNGFRAEWYEYFDEIGYNFELNCSY